MQIKTALAAFLTEFSRLELDSLPVAMRALSNDTAFVEQTEALLGLEAQLTLLERLAFSHGIPSELTMELRELLSRIRKLRDERDDLAQGAVGSIRSLGQLKALTSEAARLHEELRALTAKLSSAVINL